MDGARDPELRPTAAEWHVELKRLSDQTAQCSRNPDHYFFDENLQCPWCELAELSGTQAPLPALPEIRLPPPHAGASTLRSTTAERRIIKEVYELTPSQVAELERLLDRSTLPAIIDTSKLVTDRMDFLSDLEAMLFDDDKRPRLRERTQLQRILANGNAWLFGERYALAVDDQGLTKVLKAHRLSLGISPISDGPVVDADGHTRIVDLMLSKASLLSDRREHLVVELKCPNLKLTQAELNQILNYAVAVSGDRRFMSPHVTWEFWLLGDDMDEMVRDAVNQRNRSAGLYVEGERYRIWVRRWAELLEENRQRLQPYGASHRNQPNVGAELDELVAKYSPEPVPEQEG